MKLIEKKWNSAAIFFFRQENWFGRLVEKMLATHYNIAIHCLAQRLELSFKDSLKPQSTKLYDKLMTLLLGLYYLYRKSPKQKKSLKRSFKALNMNQILPTRVGGIRWLPHTQRAIHSFEKGYRAIRLQLETASHKNP